MRPSLTNLDVVNVALAHAVFLRELHVSQAARPDRSNIVRRQLGGAVPFAVCLPPLALHVVRVVGWRTDEQMIGVHTAPIVAAVQDEQPPGMAVMQRP